MGPQCRLLGPFSLLVQVLLGVLALSSLVFKRFREYPNRRPWKIWFFDVSKQVLGSLGVHILNVFMSILKSNSSLDDNYNFTKTSSVYYQLLQDPNQDDSSDNPCDWYFLNILFDTTIGVYILWYFLYLIHKLANKTGIKQIESGQYGNPPQFAAYFKQLVLYYVGLLSMKLVVYISLIVIPGWGPLTNWLLSWSDPFPRLQVFFVVCIFPLVMNIIQYILIDNIIQSPEYKHTPSTLNQEVQGLLGQPDPVQSETIHSPPI